MTDVTVAGHFVRSAAGDIFMLVRRPLRPLGCVLVVPPFGEEMNKCRRMIRLASVRLCAAGQAVIVPDLYGTGDSAGELAEARWPIWQNDLEAACAWAAAQGLPVTSMLAIRLGAALAVSSSRGGNVGRVGRTVFWQPVLEGGRYLTQFLRLRTAASLIAEGRKETVAVLRDRLRTGETLEVAGYPLGSGLAADLDTIELPPALPAELGQIDWMEVVRTGETRVPAASLNLAEGFGGSGDRLTLHAFPGEPFWASVEVTEVSAMVDMTARTIADGLV